MLVLNILKYLGLSFLFLLIFFLIVLLLILFFPVSYKGTLKKNENVFNAYIKASWLFGFVRILYQYPKDKIPIIKILFFKVDLTGKPKAKKRKNKNITKKNDNKNSSDIAFDSIGKDDSADDKKNKSESKSTETEKISKDIETKDSKRQNIFTKLVYKIKYEIKKIYDKIIQIWNNISKYVDIIKDPSNSELLPFLLKKFTDSFKELIPKKISGEIVFGFKEPDRTGYIYGLYSMLSGFISSELKVVPDFTKSVFFADIKFKGHSTVYKFTGIILSILFDKRIRKIYKNLLNSRKEKTNGR